ncbi:unnamed protein product [Lupinus luteus]|uniref:Uncharacterized protein n=1 Tax=Lupinus luteus TaxID=3873 RepID=A0AAV1XGA3_LUPLU
MANLEVVWRYQVSGVSFCGNCVVSSWFTPSIGVEGSQCKVFFNHPGKAIFFTSSSLVENEQKTKMGDVEHLRQISDVIICNYSFAGQLF